LAFSAEPLAGVKAIIIASPKGPEIFPG
jgi:hypothetical protein